ncbi:MAG: hypothetical protein JW821_11070 [Deltaproteobacteria bacterium]|nr:hypothetical protein [Deltaproteobacteria bacterium]
MPDQDKRPLDKIDIISFVVLILAAALFLYVAFFRTAAQSKRHLDRLTQGIEKEIQALAEGAAKKAKRSSPAAGSQQGDSDGGDSPAPVSDVPTFLQKLNKETLASGMELNNIEKLDDATYRITAYAPFYRLVSFLYKVEQANLAVQDLDIHPFSDHKSALQLILKVTGDDMSSANLQTLKAFETSYGEPFRDPFEKEPGARESPGLPDVIDLTWKFRLTGIGFDRAKFATIDHKNYYVGDSFNDMVVVDIRNDGVDLKSDSQKYLIGFRRTKKAPGGK